MSRKIFYDQNSVRIPFSPCGQQVPYSSRSFTKLAQQYDFITIIIIIIRQQFGLDRPVSASSPSLFNFQVPCVLYIGQAFRYSPENAFYVFNQQIYFII